ncbi:MULTISPECIES: hypothetical protein [unclassified Streptomyces]|uniref:hypothetical protein n=1 Tax=unclassified Streptomyces TaxID=2593676 RepID=UPI002E777B66|nr:MULTISPECIES: hypothetical protein [unclassified Streptomyces]MEE1757858.1 hypothetical protein [Streptomyces sp. SP18BB07]MEE1831809.1 hypothetical protein [Streptomyces sp. SP17KL33]
MLTSNSTGLQSEENPLAEQLKSGAAEHLALEHLDAIHVAIDDAGISGGGETGGDCVQVPLEAAGEGMEAGKVVGTRTAAIHSAIRSPSHWVSIRAKERT